MSSYVALARKWRPAQFVDIVGQGHIVRTLANAIRSERIHHAYLFTGSRGIGKTSIARIFSKVLRCDHRRTTNDILVSCDACSNCKEITAGNGVDVLEIDGASNNGVDAIREIRENAKFLPSSGSKKIYIIDEVHMLTTAAFNALLKTLEEPPAHVIFILATTEPHKIPATILSRCQRFDYRKVTLSQIQMRLSEILAAEKIEADPAALNIISRASEGSMRDALSLLDQVIAYSGTHITAATARESLGLIGREMILSTMGAILKKNPQSALETIHNAYTQGHDIKLLTRNLIETLHGIILAKVTPHSQDLANSLEASPEEWAEYQTLAQLRPLEELELLFQALHHGMDWIARSPQPKIVLEVIVIKGATAEGLARIQAVLPVNAPHPQQPPPPQTSFAKVQPPFTSEKSFDGLLEHIRKTRPFLASLLENTGKADLPNSQNRVLKLHLPVRPENDTKKDQLLSSTYRTQLNSLIKEYFGDTVSLEIALSDDIQETVASRREKEQALKTQVAENQVKSHPLIREASALFNSHIGPIQWTRSDDKGVSPP